MKTKKVFFSQPLRALMDIEIQKPEEIATYEKFYQDIVAVCEKHGYEVYLPQRYTDPQKAPALGPNRVYEANLNALLSCQLVLAYVGLPSNGVGSEVQIARSSRIPLIILYEKERESYVSQMMKAEEGVLLGIINHYSLEEIPVQLDTQLDYLLANLDINTEQKELAELEHIKILDRYVKAGDLSRRDIGQLLKKDPGYMHRILAGEINRPDRDFVLMLCHVLQLSLSDTSKVLKGFKLEGLYDF